MFKNKSKIKKRINILVHSKKCRSVVNAFSNIEFRRVFTTAEHNNNFKKMHLLQYHPYRENRASFDKNSAF